MWTLRRLLPYALLLSSTLFSGLSVVKAQNITDSVRTDGIRIGIDALTIVNNLSASNNFKLEFMGQYNRGAHLWLVESGTGSRTASVGNYTEVSKGAFMRLGYEKNFIKNGNDVFAIGGRLSGSLFQHQARDLQMGDSYWGKFTGTLPATNDFLCWLEVTSSVKVDITPYLGIGFTVRLQRKLASTYSTNFEPSYIPGFGNTNATFTPAFSYLVYFAIPFKKYRIAPILDQDKK